MKKNISLILSILILAAFASCKEKINDYAVIASAIGNVTITHGTEKHTGNSGDKIFKGDIISTGPESLADIYVGKDSIVRVYSDTNVIISDHVVSSPRNLKTLSLNLSAGEIYIHIGKQLIENNVTVKTPTSTIAVRGTRFFVKTAVDSKTGEIKSETGVIEGKVYVTAETGDKTEKIISENNSISISDKGNVTETAIPAEKSDIYIKQNSEMDEKTLHIDSKGTTEGMKTYDTAPVLNTGKELKPSAPVSLKTEAQIKQYYRKLETITLDDGTVLVGAVIEQNDKTVKIHTTNGILTLPTSSVVEVKMK